MKIEQALKEKIASALLELYQTSLPVVKLEKTNADFEGDYTFVVFPLLRASRKNPEQTAAEIGEKLALSAELVHSFNVVKGFLNIVIRENIWSEFLQKEWNNPAYALSPGTGKKVMVEYSSPNTNKPLHLGHIRNILLGYSVAEIMKATGYAVTKANLVNDRGIHICKSMLAWQRFGNGETPENGIKGDHLAGKYYVIFENALRAETEEVIKAALSGDFTGTDAAIQPKLAELYAILSNPENKEEKKEKARDEIKETIRNHSPLMQECQEMLRQWEAGNPDVLHLWKTMNGWVYDGFDVTYKRLGVDFDKWYYESNTYTLGKDIIEEGLSAGVFYRRDDGSVWIDLTAEGLDHKLVLRKDGTSVYITQDIGTAELKYRDYGLDQSIYVVGNEQDYHFKVLFQIMRRLGRPYAEGMHHLSYGMVDLPSGKMKSREGTVVDADDLLDEMHATAREKTIELGKTEGLEEAALNELFEKLGLAALKFFILKVDPKKRMLFNPSESIDFQGDTGPFVMYTYARIQSVLRQAGEGWQSAPVAGELHTTEKETLECLYAFPEVLHNAARDLSPALICQYALDLAKAFNRIYSELSLLHETDPARRATRLKIASFTAQSLKMSMNLLGIKEVERM
ncbi:MAG: arginine--tRNA ligase [Bacteroidetes bacterium]|nr:arginine--tRNA ligase [Bacteroidota bacterium]